MLWRAARAAPLIHTAPLSPHFGKPNQQQTRRPDPGGLSGPYFLFYQNNQFPVDWKVSTAEQPTVLPRDWHRH
jgi:hypothetical protein